jgi:ACS family hexuronate transporter-like MFS transporter
MVMMRYLPSSTYRAGEGIVSKRPHINPWAIIALLFVVAVLNYFDRQSLSVVAPRMQAELHLSDTGYAHIVSLFLLASAFAYALSGFVCDALGTRKSMALFVSFWSLAEASTAIATSAVILGLTRFCLGLGEPGLWVAAPKAVGEILKKPQRSLGVGVYTAGATLGAIVAIPAILAITTYLPWRTIFLIDGAMGLLWVPVWLWLYRDHASESSNNASTSAFRDVIGRRETWQFMIARGMTDPVWYFYLFWFPKFLLSERHLSNTQLSQLGWIVYLAGGIGTIAGGFLSGSIIRSGIGPGRAYRRTMLYSAVAVLVSPLVYLSPTIAMVIVFASIVALAHMSWLINLTSTLLEIFPLEQVGKAAGLIAAGSAFGGMLSSEIIGYFVSHGGYRPVFFIMGCMHPLAITLLWNAFEGKPRHVANPQFVENPS